MKTYKPTESGFTLIELIVVIVILGILAATALPKFVSLTSDARIASLNAVRGAMSATAAMAHGKYLVTSPAPASILAEGTVITFATAVASGYPKADAGFVAASGISTQDFTIITAGSAATANSPATNATETALLPNSLAGTPSGATCYVKYTEPLTITSAPTVSIVSVGC